jgi:hypothetical protein
MLLIPYQLLLILSAPFLAASTGKKKIAKRATTKKSLPKRTRAAKKPARVVKKSARPANKSKTPKPGARNAKGKKQRLNLPLRPAVAQPAPAEPLPKPAPPIGRAILLVPENDKFTDSQHPTFRWLSVGGATRYEITWSEDSDFQSAYSIASIATEATVPVEKPLRIGGTYHWRVRGGNESGWGPWSASAAFRVLAENE